MLSGSAISTIEQAQGNENSGKPEGMIKYALPSTFARTSQLMYTTRPTHRARVTGDIPTMA